MKEKIVVIGAGIGGLTAAAILARHGYDVTVLEAHIYAGGCAGTFYHQGYRFEAGATLAGGFYPGGPMDLVAQATGVLSWPARPSAEVMQVHLSDGAQITRYGDERRWDERQRVFGPAAEGFFRWQEETADALWSLALRSPAWPPQSVAEGASLLSTGAAWLGERMRTRNALALPGLAIDALSPVSRHLVKASDRLRLFVDGQLLIAAQTTSAHANALYGASALDLPRRGVVHLDGGIGVLAETLASAVERNFQTDRAAYEARKRAFAHKVLGVAERAIPGLSAAVQLCKPGTPVTFRRFTRRQWGWVGGFPQTSLFRAWSPRLMDGLWMVGDSIFPGQSTAAVALGGMRVAESVGRYKQ